MIFQLTAPNTVWASDITYIRTRQGWLYLCAVLDLFSRKAIGWAMSSRIDTKLVIDAVEMAVFQRQPKTAVLFHSDRGSQYASDSFRELLKKYNFTQSMSRKGDCWDNACVESFFSTLKTEAVAGYVYQSRDEARYKLFDYVAAFYNRIRRHSYLDYNSPEEYESIMSMQKMSLN